jgi:hypothetical protein
MIRISEPITIDRILTDESWKTIPLELTSSGLGQFKKLTASDSRKPVVYVHVESATQRVLRIGIACKGIHDRWTRATNGHISTFEWSMEYSTTYKGMAWRFPQYVLFFRRLANLRTTVWTVTCCSEQSAKRVEKILTLEFQPVWEKFDSLCKTIGIRKGQPAASTVDDRTFADPGLPDLNLLQSGRTWPLRFE